MFFPGGRSDSAVAVRVSGMMIWRENENHIARDYYTASVSATAACGAQEDTKLLFFFLLTQGDHITLFFFLAHFGWLEFSKLPVWWNILSVQLS